MQTHFGPEEAGQRDAAKARRAIFFPKPAPSVPANMIPGPVRMIQRVVCEYYGVTLSRMLSRDAHREITAPRQMAMFMCRQHTDMSVLDLGVRFRRDHSSITCAEQRVRQRMTDDRQVARDVHRINRRLAEVLNG